MESSIDRETVIKGLECCAGQCNYHGCPYKDPCENANGVKQIMLDALALLKEQEPKPVKVVKNAYNHEFYYCPRCERSFYNLIYGKPKFCDKCGQELMWE